jgi:hypothetical protein
MFEERRYQNSLKGDFREKKTDGACPLLEQNVTRSVARSEKRRENF